MQKKILFITLLALPFVLKAQVNAVEFGKNRVQHKKFNWKFYQSPNFNTYIAQGGTELGKFVAQVAEEELPGLEAFIEYSLQRRGNIVVYNNYNDFKSSNIGSSVDWQNSGGLTRLVNNKIVTYFDGNHANLRRQIREGIARILTDNLLFGDDIGEFASNQALLDLPKWLVDGYVAYAAEDWSPTKDDELKSAILGGNYNSFYQFAFDRPLLAGHSFWRYMSSKYKKESVTYFLYLSRIYKNLNAASLRICKKKFKDVLKDFMYQEQERYVADIRQRRNQPKGTVSVSEDVSRNEYFRFQVNPNARNNSYSVVEFKKGIYRVKLMDNFYDATTLLKLGVRTNLGDINPNYPIMSWDGKGQRLLVMYWEAGKIKMFVYDNVAKYKRYKQEIIGLDQVLDASFMLDANTLVMSAVKNGHTDIFTYKIEEQKLTQITDDVYDDIDPSYITFPNKSGIVFSSNRPSPYAPSNDTILPSKNKYSIFMVDILNTTKTKQITQLSESKYGNARYPMQYNNTHFTYLTDENGIGNRWAGFFSTQRNGLDTLYFVGDELLRNPSIKELDSALLAWQKQEPDSISYFQVYKDSTYSFPLTNYQSSLTETRIAGNNGQVSEVRREGDYKFLYKLKVDENTLKRRNINPRPTEYMKKIMTDKKTADGQATNYGKKTTTKQTVGDTVRKKKPDVFATDFDDDSKDTIATKPGVTAAATAKKPTILSTARLFNYKKKFSTDYILAGFTNNILINRFQPYSGGQGPIQLNNGSDLNMTTRVGVTDLMEDIKFVGGFRINTGLQDKDVFFTFMNYRRKLDWGFTYYRSTNSSFSGLFPPGFPFNSRLFTNLYQGNLVYAFNETKSLRANIGLRFDRGVAKPGIDLGGGAIVPDRGGLSYPDTLTKYAVGRLEYVHDESINPAMNIWNGLRWKVYLDYMLPFGEATSKRGKATFNLGFDARYYYKIYRNFIWAGRAAGDFSWGGKKIIYYLGGVDGWLGPRFNSKNTPAPDQQYAFQSLALQMRGFNQNVSNGNNALVINSEFRFPVFSTIFNKPINNAFLRNFQLTQFIDLGAAWNGRFKNIQRPTEIISDPRTTPVVIRLDAGGLGPFAGGYGFGARTTLLGYFLKVDAGWPMRGIFKGKPLWFFSLGLDF